eukprot:9892211-Prorocentrum_lima.AAC.1
MQQASWAQYQALQQQQFPVHMPAPMVSPGFITLVTAPSNQGQVPALTAPTDQELSLIHISEPTRLDVI